METNKTLALGTLVSGEYSDVAFTGMVSQRDSSGFTVTLDAPIFVYSSERDALWGRYDSALRDSLKVTGQADVALGRDSLVGAYAVRKTR